MVKPSGFKHWLLQRMTGVLLIPLSLLFITHIISVSDSTYTQIKAYLAQPFIKITMSLFLMTVAYHSYLGLEVIYEDYIPHRTCRCLLKILSACLMGSALIIGIISVLF